MQTPQTGLNNKSAVPLVLSIVLFIFLFLATHPFYKHYIDPDAASYLTIATQYAKGNFMRAVNGLWSPLHPWLVALCVGGGMEVLWAAQLTNAMACMGILVCCHALFNRYELEKFTRISFLTVLPVFLLYCLYKQLFCDLWQILFLLIYLLLITSKDYLHNSWKWIAYGLLAALAYLSKTYSFHFLLLHYPITLFLLAKKEGLTRKAIVRPYITGTVTQLLLMAPWVYLLHQKYGKWTLGYAGSLNTTWLLLGHKTFKPGIGAVIPPPFPDSPSNMEDPFFIQGASYTMFSSPKLFMVQIVRSVLSFIQGIDITHEVSIFLFVVLVATAVCMFFKKGQQLFNNNHRILLWASLIMPAGYVLQHFEARYIWLLAFTGMIFGAVWLETLRKFIADKRLYRAMVLLFGFSFIVYPVMDLKALFRKGEDVYQEAQKVKVLGLNGSFVTNGDPNRGCVSAYLMNMPDYVLEKDDVTQQELLAEMRRYQVKYYFFYHKPYDAAAIRFCDEKGNPFPEVSQGRIAGLKIYLVHP